MESWQICGAALICVMAAVVVKQMKGEFILPLRIAISIVLMGGALGIGIPLFRYLRTLIDGGALSEYADILFKSFGIAMLTHVTSEICRDAGEASVASYVELAGKFELLILGLPLVAKVLETTSEILNWRI